MHILYIIYIYIYIVIICNCCPGSIMSIYLMRKYVFGKIIGNKLKKTIEIKKFIKFELCSLQGCLQVLKLIDQCSYQHLNIGGLTLHRFQDTWLFYSLPLPIYFAYQTPKHCFYVTVVPTFKANQMYLFPV